MQDTQSIRPEIKGLFDTIKEQSVKYNEAFEHLERQTYAYRMFMNELNDLAENVKSTLNNKIRSIDVKVEDSIRILKLEHNKTINKYTELRDLKYLQDTFQNAVDSINQIKETFDRHVETNKRIVNEFDRTLLDFKKKSNNELEIFMTESQTKINTLTANEFAKMEEKIAIRQRQIEGRMISLDQTFWNNFDKLAAEFKNMGKEFDGLKSIISSINHVAEDQTKKLKTQFDATRDKMENNIEFLNTLIKEFQDKLENLNRNYESRNSDTPQINVVKKESDPRYAALELNFKNLQSDFDDLSTKIEQKSNTPTLVSIIAIFVAIAAIAVAIFM